MSSKGQYWLKVLDLIKENPEYKNYHPSITTSGNIYTGYKDYWVMKDKAGNPLCLLILTETMLPTTIGPVEYLVMIINPDDIESVYINTILNIDLTAVPSATWAPQDTMIFFRSMLRFMEGGFYNWNVAYRRYSFRVGNVSFLVSPIDVDYSNDTHYTAIIDYFQHDAAVSLAEKKTVGLYDYLLELHIPLINLAAAGAKLGVFPDELVEYMDTLKKNMLISDHPTPFLTTKKRRSLMANNYGMGDTVLDPATGKSYISIAQNNNVPLDATNAWREISYTHPGPYTDSSGWIYPPYKGVVHSPYNRASALAGIGGTAP
jgi:hypothetical protein